MTDTEHPSARYDDRAQRYADTFQDEALTAFPVDRNMIRMLVDLGAGTHVCSTPDAAPGR